MVGEDAGSPSAAAAAALVAGAVERPTEADKAARKERKERAAAERRRRKKLRLAAKRKILRPRRSLEVVSCWLRFFSWNFVFHAVVHFLCWTMAFKIGNH